MRKLLTLVLAVAVIVSLVAVGCAKPVPAPAPAPTPAPAPAPSPHEPFQMYIYGPPAHVSSYVLAVAMSEVISKYSEWLKCTAVEGTSPPNNAKRIFVDPDLRKRSLMHCPNPNHWELVDVPGLTKDIDYDFSQMRYVLYLGLAANGMISVNPEVRTIADFKGKRINVSDTPPPDQFSTLIFSQVKAAGLDPDKDIKKQTLNFGQSHIALKDGLVDSVLTGFVASDTRANQWLAASYLEEVISTKHTYYIDFDAEALKKTMEETGLPYPPYVIPANTLKWQTEPWTLAVKYMAWVCYPEFPDDVVAEILRIISEHYSELAEFNPAFADVCRQNLGLMGPSLQYYHPVAMKFFKDNGIQVGILD